MPTTSTSGFIGPMHAATTPPDATLNGAGKAPVTGMFYFDTDNNQICVYTTDSVWRCTAVLTLQGTTTSTTTTTTTTTTTSTSTSTTAT